MTTRYIREAVLRFYYILLSATITLFCSYYFSEQIVYVLALVYINAADQTRSNGAFSASHEPQFIYTELTEAFGVSLLISFSVTLWTLLPSLIFQLWQFTKPGLYIFENYGISCAIVLSSVLSLATLGVCYFFILPAACKFFLSYEITSIHLHLEAKIYTYIRLILRWLFFCQLIFQLPLLVFIVDIFRFRKFVYPLFALLCAFAPDIVSQLVLSIGVVFLYEASIFIVKLSDRVRYARLGTPGV